MTTHDLPALIRQLHRELASLDTLDHATREELRRLAADLERVAGEEAAAGETDSGLRDRLSHGVKRFEASHPALSETFANLIDALALYGL
ncbi:MAG: hypothetical protein H6R40_205 [Gemmatimonadetes bacterium]|nr:hypothetical protein [Gemmatimonadota bacterium]